MKARTSFFAGLLVVLMSGAACSASDTVVGINAVAPHGAVVTEEMYRVSGHGSYFSPVPQPDLVVAAIRTYSGNVSGTVVFPEGGGRMGSVIGIVSPTTAYNYWCVASTLNDQPGVTLLIYIDDAANGADQVSFGGGPGATCEEFPVPPSDWMPLLSGDFTGTVKTK